MYDRMGKRTEQQVRGATDVAEPVAAGGVSGVAGRFVPVPVRGLATGPVVRRLVDPVDKKHVTVERISAKETTKQQLQDWQKLLEWDEDELQAAIEKRLAEIDGEELAAADAAAKAKDEQAADEARKAQDAERAKLRKEVEDAAGAPLENYDETVDRTLRGSFTDTTYKAPVLSARFFTAVATVEEGQTPGQVLAQLIGDPVALEAFVYGNGALLGAGKAEPTDVRAALAVSAAWTALGDKSQANDAVQAICAQIAAGRIRPIRNEYRKATLTSTAGLIYRFGRLEPKRALANAEIHLHPGKKNDLNNAGLKDHSAGKKSKDRVQLSPGAYNSWRGAIKARGLWSE